MQPHFRQRPANLRLQNGRTIPVTHLDAATAADARSVQSDRFHPLRHFLTTARCAALGERPNSSINTVVLRDLVFIGDGGLFLERIITPIFQALAFELATKGGNGCEPALRITYDDANESFVLPSNVAEILRHLHCQYAFLATPPRCALASCTPCVPPSPPPAGRAPAPRLSASRRRYMLIFAMPYA